MAYAPRLLMLPADQPRLSRLICFVLGCLTTLAFAPFGLSYLLPLLLLPLLFVCLTGSPRDAAEHGFWYGFGLFLTGTYWIYISVVVFGQAPAWIAVLLMFGLTLVMSLWTLAAAWITNRLAQGEPLQLLAVAPPAWVLVEWLRGWVLSGFPWLAYGYAHVDTAFAGWAPVAGVYGVSFAIVLTSAALLASLLVQAKNRWLTVSLVFLPWFGGVLLSMTDWTEEVGQPVRVTVLQGGIPQDKKWLPEYRQTTLDYYRDATRIARNSDVVVWPEVAIPSLSSREAAFIAQLQADARESAQTILFGILEDDPGRGEDTVYNSVIALDGATRQQYRKRHLVPFGEYFPVPDSVREWMKMMSLPHSDLTPGQDQQSLIVLADGTRVAVAICYEDAYGAEQIAALPDAQLFVNVSNDAWFGNSIAPHQHLQIARMRSLEFSRATIRATNTGISAFIDHRGTIDQAGPQFRAAELSATVQPRQGSTPYAAFGNTPVIGFSLVVLGFFWFRSQG